MTRKELYDKINAILDEYTASPLIADEVTGLIDNGEPPRLVIIVLLEAMRIRQLRDRANREMQLARRGVDDADLLERLLLD